MDKFNHDYEEFNDEKEPSVYLSITESEEEYRNNSQPLINFIEENNENNENNNSIGYSQNNNTIGYSQNNFNNSYNRKFNESSKFKSIPLWESDNIWNPNFEDGTWNYNQPKRRTYYDTQEIQYSLDETSDILKNNMLKLSERENKIIDMDSKTTNLLSNAEKFKSKAINLKYKMLTQYLFHIISLSILLILIIVLIVKLV